MGALDVLRDDSDFARFVFSVSNASVAVNPTFG